jgi:hypothetical protein
MRSDGPEQRMAEAAERAEVEHERIRRQEQYEQDCDYQRDAERCTDKDADKALEAYADLFDHFMDQLP